MASRRLLIETKREEFINKTDKVLSKQGKTQATKKNYKFHVGRFLDSQGIDVTKTSRQDLNNYMKGIHRKVKKGEVNRSILLQTSAALSLFFKYVVPKPSLRGTTQEFLKEAK